MSDVILPVIEHATVTLNERNRVVIQMDDGWVFYDTRDYEGYVDLEGNPCDPAPEDYQYYRYGVFSPATDFVNRIVVVAESNVPSNQIYGLGNNTETM